MRALRSIQGRLALAIGLGVTLAWIAAALATTAVLRHEMDEVFDSALEETAQRLLPLAVLDILGREEEGVAQRIATLRAHEEYFTYLVRDRQGRVLLASHAADESVFPPYEGPGFRRTATHRLYYDAALRGTVTIAVAEPLAHRAEVAREMGMGLGLPLLAVIPFGLAAILVAVRLAFRPVRRLGDDLAARGPRDLSPVEATGMPTEVEPIATAVNQLLGRLVAAFEAERSFASNAAHELRTPLAGAIAQAQRLRAETDDERAAARAAEIESTLKRLARLSEKLLQLARAEGGPLRTDRAADLRPVLRLVTEDLTRGEGTRVGLSLPPEPVLSDIDPDAFGILCRNLVENALRHGTQGTPVEVGLAPDGTLTVANDAPPLPPDRLAHLTARFERASPFAEGSGLGLAIARTIVERAGGTLRLESPVPGRDRGFRAVAVLPGIQTPRTGHGPGPGPGPHGPANNGIAGPGTAGPKPSGFRAMDLPPPNRFLDVPGCRPRAPLRSAFPTSAR